MGLGSGSGLGLGLGLGGHPTERLAHGRLEVAVEDEHHGWLVTIPSLTVAVAAVTVPSGHAIVAGVSLLISGLISRRISRVTSRLAGCACEALGRVRSRVAPRLAPSPRLRGRAGKAARIGLIRGWATRARLARVRARLKVWA